VGGPKARGFALILGITTAEIDHLAAQIELGIQPHPVKATVDNEPYGWKCVVEFSIQGAGATVIINAFLKV
jgi:hypothetical protein